MSGKLTDYQAAKRSVKNNIKRHDHFEWIGTCVLYDKLNIYTEIVHSVKIHTWWIVTQKNRSGQV